MVQHESQCKVCFRYLLVTMLWGLWFLGFLLLSFHSVLSCLSFIHHLNFFLVHLSAHLATWISSLYLTLESGPSLELLSGLWGLRSHLLLLYGVHLCPAEFHAPWPGQCLSLLYWEPMLKLVFLECPLPLLTHKYLSL